MDLANWVGTANLHQDRDNSSIVRRILLLQAGTTLGLALVLGYWGEQTALSALIGGAICLVPNLYLARKLFGKREARPEVVVKALYLAELGKLFITASLFVLVFTTLSWIQPLALFGGYIAAQAVQWVTPLIVRTKGT